MLSSTHSDSKDNCYFYVRGLPAKVSKFDLFSLFRALPITNIHLNAKGSDFTSDAKVEIKGRRALNEALATFNKVQTNTLDGTIEVSANDDFSSHEQSNGSTWLQVTQVSEHANTHDLYHIFRETGPMVEFFISTGREGKPLMAWVKYISKSLAHKGVQDHHFKEYMKKSFSVKIVQSVPDVDPFYFVNFRLPVPRDHLPSQQSEPMSKHASNADSGYITSPASQADTFNENRSTHSSSSQSEPHQDFDSKVLYVYNLNSEIDNTELFNMFKSYGFITSAIVVKDRLGKSKGYGSVRFTKSSDPSKAYQSYISSKSSNDPIELEIGRPRNVSGIQSASTKKPVINSEAVAAPLAEISPEDYRNALNEKISQLKGIDSDNVNYVTQLLLDLYPEFIQNLLQNQNLLQQKVLTVLSKLVNSTPKVTEKAEERETQVILEPFKSLEEQPAFIRDMNAHLKSISDDKERREEFSSYLFDFVETAGAKDPDEMTRRLAFKSADIFVIVQIMFDQVKFTKLIKQLDGTN
ncbi:hypothetical protein CONCODRAFT_80512 [Conidiobolus coronatus NRRL 28638]|uniref:RRM domain-containing protein n=1 Tax=Conidiobolus coronatus (strain ATCC 28846 / CBS 209.66 / NRRL 28638) TaxID=796925 RepID=A0A137NUL4_CONC2|nr:hypothetical protein CONCODRAFT_80512 [Conidiobolus coronatus NRRL 28638]|eukprot:KXN66361.1 hypothetical protein CONCODRAFT_80512 [Conidiobolus coronatus NRRL 28638]